MPEWLLLLGQALAAAPKELQIVETAINDHWGKDHVQQLVKGASYLKQIAESVVSVATQQATNVVTPTAGNPVAQGPMDTAGHNES